MLAQAGATYKGVAPTAGGCFLATIAVASTAVALGSYATPHEAARAHDVAALALYGQESAVTNHPRSSYPPREISDCLQRLREQHQRGDHDVVFTLLPEPGPCPRAASGSPLDGPPAPPAPAPAHGVPPLLPPAHQQQQQQQRPWEAQRAWQEPHAASPAVVEAAAPPQVAVSAAPASAAAAAGARTDTAASLDRAAAAATPADSGGAQAPGPHTGAVGLQPGGDAGCASPNSSPAAAMEACAASGPPEQKQQQQAVQQASGEQQAKDGQETGAEGPVEAPAVPAAPQPLAQEQQQQQVQQMQMQQDLPPQASGDACDGLWQLCMAAAGQAMEGSEGSALAAATAALPGAGEGQPELELVAEGGGSRRGSKASGAGRSRQQATETRQQANAALRPGPPRTSSGSRPSASVAAHSGGTGSAAGTSYRGIILRRNGRYDGRLTVLGVKLYLGVFKEPADAARAYDVAALALYQDAAATNFPRSDYTPQEVSAKRAELLHKLKNHQNAAGSKAGDQARQWAVQQLQLDEAGWQQPWAPGSQDSWPMGAFKEPADAARAYDVAALALYQDAAATNFPRPDYTPPAGLVQLPPRGRKPASSDDGVAGGALSERGARQQGPLTSDVSAGGWPGTLALPLPAAAGLPGLAAAALAPGEAAQGDLGRAPGAAGRPFDPPDEQQPDLPPAKRLRTAADRDAGAAPALPAGGGAWSLAPAADGGAEGGGNGSPAAVAAGRVSSLSEWTAAAAAQAASAGASAALPPFDGAAAAALEGVAGMDGGRLPSGGGPPGPVEGAVAGEQLSSAFAGARLAPGLMAAALVHPGPCLSDGEALTWHSLPLGPPSAPSVRQASSGITQAAPGAVQALTAAAAVARAAAAAAAAGAIASSAASGSVASGEAAAQQAAAGAQAQQWGPLVYQGLAAAAAAAQAQGQGQGQAQAQALAARPGGQPAGAGGEQPLARSTSQGSHSSSHSEHGADSGAAAAGTVGVDSAVAAAAPVAPVSPPPSRSLAASHAPDFASRVVCRAPVPSWARSQGPAAVGAQGGPQPALALGRVHPLGGGREQPPLAAGEQPRGRQHSPPARQRSGPPSGSPPGPQRSQGAPMEPATLLEPTPAGGAAAVLLRSGSMAASGSSAAATQWAGQGGGTAASAAAATAQLLLLQQQQQQQQLLPRGSTPPVASQGLQQQQMLASQPGQAGGASHQPPAAAPAAAPRGRSQPPADLIKSGPGCVSHAQNPTGQMGVRSRKNKFEAFVATPPFRYLYLGQFDRVEAAVEARDAAMLALYGRDRAPQLFPDWVSAGGAAAVGEAQLRAVAARLVASKASKDQVVSTMRESGTIGLLPT